MALGERYDKRGILNPLSCSWNPRYISRLVLQGSLGLSLLVLAVRSLVVELGAKD